MKSEAKKSKMFPISGVTFLESISFQTVKKMRGVCLGPHSQLERCLAVADPPVRLPGDRRPLTNRNNSGNF